MRAFNQGRVVCVGHRGAMGYEPENTLRSFRKALEQKVDWIELDVYIVEDSLVVIHENPLARTTNGKGLLMEQSLAYVRSLDAGKGEKIPLLSEVFDLIDQEAGIVIELKGPNTAVPTVKLIQERIMGGWSYDNILVSAYDHRALKKVKELDPKIQIGALTLAIPVENAAFAEALDAFSVHVCEEFVDQEFINDAHQRGIKVLVFSMFDKWNTDAMKHMGVDGIFTNYPDLL